MHEEDKDLCCLKRVLVETAEALIRSKKLLTQIDSLSGDGDLGISMEKVAVTVLREIEKDIPDGIAGLLSRCAVAVNKDAPSTMGTLTSFAIMEAAKIMKGKAFFTAEDILLIPQKMTEIIMIHGRAQEGDKTVLDALIPYSKALEEAYRAGGSVAGAAASAAEAAALAANGTKGWTAKIGRAKWIAERSRGCPDGGAVVCALAVNAIVGKQIEISLED